MSNNKQINKMRLDEKKCFRPCAVMPCSVLLCDTCRETSHFADDQIEKTFMKKELIQMLRNNYWECQQCKITNKLTR